MRLQGVRGSLFLGIVHHSSRLISVQERKQVFRMPKHSVTDLDSNMRLKPLGDVPYQWFDPLAMTQMRISGFNWIQNDCEYRRMPVSPLEPLPTAVDSLANCCAGGQVCFITDSPRIAIHARFTAPHGTDHMPATCTLGFDCYEGTPGSMKYLSTARFTITQQEYTVPLFDRPEIKKRLITINMPLYNSVLEKFEIGLAPNAEPTPPPPRSMPGKVVVYGTSITQGGCASRPGMCYTNQLSRKIDVEFINLGFSGAGKGETSVVKTIESIDDMSLLILDYEANIGVGLVDNLPGYVDTIRKKHPILPIIVLSKIKYGSFNLNPDEMEKLERLREFQRDFVSELREKGDENIHFIDGSKLLGDDYDDCAVDGCHPTDLGFHRMTDGLLNPILEILNPKTLK